MKIIYLYQYFITPTGAGSTRAYEMGRRLVKMGHEVHMVTSDSGWMRNSKAIRKLEWYDTDEDGIRVHWLPVPYSNYMGFVGRLKAFFRFMLAARRKAISLGGDIVFATSSPLTIAIPGVAASKKNKVPLVFEVRDLWPEAPIQMGKLNNPVLRWMAKRLELYAYRNATRTVGLSPGMKEGIVAAGMESHRVEVVPNSSDLELFSQVGEVLETAKASFGVDGKFVLSYCGTMGEANGLNFVLDAAEELEKRGVHSIAFLLVGDGKEKPTLIEEARTRKLSSIVFADPVPKSEVVTVFEATDVSMTIFKNVPILRTCSPNKLFDALAAGRPILTNMPGWLGDIAEYDRTGILVDPENPRDFADKVVWMNENPDVLRKFSVNARKVAETRFNRDVIAKRLEKVLLAAVEEAGGGDYAGRRA